MVIPRSTWPSTSSSSTRTTSSSRLAVAQFLGEGPVDDSLVVIATETHRHAFRRHLESMGFDVGRACESGQLTFFDAIETLSRFMRNGEPDGDLFELEVGNVIGGLTAALSDQRRLRAYGEMVDVLWKEGAAEGSHSCRGTLERPAESPLVHAALRLRHGELLQRASRLPSRVRVPHTRRPHG